MKPPALIAAAAICFTALRAHADGGAIGHVFAREGRVVVERACRMSLVAESELLRLTDFVHTAQDSHASVHVPGFGHLDLAPDSSIQFELFYRSPNVAALASLLEISVQAGGFLFVAEEHDAFETRLSFRNGVVYIRNATVNVEARNGAANVSLLTGEILVESKFRVIRHQAPAFAGTFGYRTRLTECEESS